MTDDLREQFEKWVKLVAAQNPAGLADEWINAAKAGFEAGAESSSQGRRIDLLKAELAEADDEARSAEAELERLREALRRIASPIASLAADAKRDGMKLDGYMAVQLADDAGYLKGIAEAALAASSENHSTKEGK